MNWTAWIAEKHALIVHIPIAAALMIPLPIIAAQRGGRGIRPWWVTCRYLAWIGTAGSLLALVSGLCLARVNGILPPGTWFTAGTPGLAYLFRLHEGGGAGSLVLGILCIRALYRKRQEHQGIGILALFAGLAWSACACFSAYSGSVLAGQRPAPRYLVAPPEFHRAEAPRPLPPPPPASPADPEAKAPYRALDYLALKPQHAEPVKSAAHGNRWIRVWVSPEAEKAYQSGEPLPPGALVVMSTQEDRWGRPGPDAGPLYALEAGKDGPKLTFYWPQVPEARRAEVQGEPSAYWRDADPRLRSCQACHGQGAAPVKDRSTWGVPRKPRPDGTAPAPAAPHAPTPGAPAPGTPHAPAPGTPHAPTPGTSHAPAPGSTHAPSTGTPHPPSTATPHVPSTGTPHAPSTGAPHAPAPDSARPAPPAA